MVRIIIMVLAVVLLLPASGPCAEKEPQAARIRMVFGGYEVVVSIFDTPAGRDFMSLLPLQAEFTDFAGKEKIAYLPRKLTTSGAPTVRSMQGDFAYFRPWGNLAVFYKGFGSSDQVTVLGRIESGKERLASMGGSFNAMLEKME